MEPNGLEGAQGIQREPTLYIPDLTASILADIFPESTGFLSLVPQVHDPRAQKIPTRVGLFHLNVTGVELDENQSWFKSQVCLLLAVQFWLIPCPL